MPRSKRCKVKVNVTSWMDRGEAELALVGSAKAVKVLYPAAFFCI